MEISEFYFIVFWGIVAFLVSKALIPVLLNVARRKKLFDDGNDIRKLHKGLIPTLGGVAIFFAFLVCFSASSFADDVSGFGYLVAASLILVAAGLKDDLLVISVSKKLAAQLLATGLVIFGCGIQFIHMGDVFEAQFISPWIGIPLTFFTVIVVTNAQNLIDGIDGLSGSLAVMATAFFGYWFYTAEVYPWATFSFILMGSILGFLWYNRPPAKIFMGDTGSLLIGFYLAILAIKFVNLSISETTVVYWQPAAPIIAAAVLSVTLYDTLRVFILRTFNGRSPFQADREHVHHHLLEMGFKHGQIVLILLSLNIVVLGTIIGMSAYLSNTWLLGLLLGISVLIFPTNKWKRKVFKVFVPDTFDKETVQDPESQEELEAENQDYLPKKDLENVETREAAQAQEL